jgi:hypothetical protein
MDGDGNSGIGILSSPFSSTSISNASLENDMFSTRVQLFGSCGQIFSPIIMIEDTAQKQDQQQTNKTPTIPKDTRLMSKNQQSRSENQQSRLKVNVMKRPLTIEICDRIKKQTISEHNLIKSSFLM